MDDDTTQLAAVKPDRNVLWPALRVGATAGVCGFTFGATVGVLKSAPPVMFGTAAAFQWFVLCGTFSAIRPLMLQSKLVQQSSQPSLLASIASGAAAGGVSGLIRGKANILPGIVVCSTVSGLGDTAYRLIQTRQDRPKSVPQSQSSSWSWLPIKTLSNAEYADKLRDRLNLINAEIAALDSEIQQLQTQKLEKEQPVAR